MENMLNGIFLLSVIGVASLPILLVGWIIETIVERREKSKPRTATKAAQRTAMATFLED